MNILIDASNISVGGGLQVSVSVINELINNYSDRRIIFAVSERVYSQLTVSSDNLQNIFVVDFKRLSLYGYYKYRKSMLELESTYSVGVVFSIFGPTYWHPKNANHLIGFANAWLVSPKSKAYTALSFTSKYINILKNKILSWMLYSPKYHYVTETEAVKRLFCNKFQCSHDMISVVPNCLSQIFEASMENDIFGLKGINKFKFVTITHNYPHKNLKVIPEVGKYLNELGVDCIFVVTIPHNEYSHLSDEFKEYSLNIGPVSISQCKSVYLNCDALFLPSLIECFTVSYLEAFATNTTILTSDLDFARDICGESAFYFDPYNVHDIGKMCARVIFDYYNGSERIKAKKTLYSARLSSFGTNEDRVCAYMEIVEKLMRN